MIHVLEVKKINTGAFVLVCDRFSDEKVTKSIRSDLGIHDSFEVERIRECFSTAKTRDVVIFGEIDVSNVTEIEFV